ncbi:MAG TPA: alpha/beta fold hydrolase [Gemmatimonadaceae bacterium]|nr:alpha/beta fold hydrolase [Gemmatimonadaceae bacterium]
MPASIVLLHGLGRTYRSMLPIARAAEARGYRVLNVAYPSRTAPIEALAERVAHEAQAFAGAFDAHERVHFVTHSLGGILLRAAVAAGLLPLDRVGRAVMLAPPNQGSELPDALGGRPLLGPLYRQVTGPAGAQLGTGPAGVPARLPPVEFELGVIAGSRSLNPLLSRYIEGPDDGKVSVGRAAVPGMRDFLVVPHSHTFLMRAPAVVEQVLHFLERGAFAR